MAPTMECSASSTDRSVFLWIWTEGSWFWTGKHVFNSKFWFSTRLALIPFIVQPPGLGLLASRHAAAILLPVAAITTTTTTATATATATTATTANIPVFALRRDISKQSIYSCFWSSWGKYFSNCLMFCVWSRHFPFLCLWHLLLRLWVWVMTSSRLKYRHLIVEKRYSHRKYQT